MIVADGGSSWYMSGTPDSAWLDFILNPNFNVISGLNMEAVDVSSQIVSPTSYQIKTIAPTPSPANLPVYKYPYCSDIIPGRVPKYQKGDRSGIATYSTVSEDEDIMGFLFQRLIKDLNRPPSTRRNEALWLADATVCEFTYRTVSTARAAIGAP